MMETACCSSDEQRNKLGFCEVCAVIDAKYTCPRCEVKTCSLKCSKIHKLELECDGHRDKTKFIYLNKFTNLDLSSDYRLLEEITRNVEGYKKDTSKRFTRIRKDLPYHLFRLQNAALSRRTSLKYLPGNFGRHKVNSTRLNYDTNTIFWHIDWIFYNAENLKLTDKSVPESTRISSLLQKFLINQEDLSLNDQLQYYKSADLYGVKVFLKAEEKAGEKYYELDPCDTVREVLRNKIIIEYPTFHVVLKDHCNGYHVIDSDDEDEVNVNMKVKSGRAVVDRLIKKAENDDTLYTSMKNLLFIADGLSNH